MTSNQTNSQGDSVKILLMGLDNSGKTSLVLSLSKETNLLSYCSIKPTQGCNITTIDEYKTKYSIWDLGGQTEYRPEYLDNFDKYFHGINRFIYVIDVQDEDRYDIAFKYLESIIEKMKDKKVSFEFSVFLHKFDPVFEMRTAFNKKVDNELINKIRKIVPTKYKPKIFKTSIYTMFKKTPVP
jgi:small GTP-binding protein